MAKNSEEHKYSTQEILNLIYDPIARTIDAGSNALADVWDSVNHFLKVQEQFQPAFEDNTNSVAKVEHQYTGFRITADTQIKGSPGFVHAITISPTTATPTAGLLTVYNSLTEAGTAIYSEWIFATTPGHTVILDRICDTGIYVGYDGTLASVSVAGSYR